MIVVQHDVPCPQALLGLIRAEGIDVARAPDRLDDSLAALLDQRRAPLTEAEEATRRAARDLLRNGAYKPTGRGKPASEYLVRAAQDANRTFPRINSPVDICNYISLKALLPISLWDLDLAATDHFRFRLGRPGEGYVFNTGGQIIDVQDLLVGCRVREDGEDEPIVNPVKDSLATKTTDATRRVAACMYASVETVSAEDLETLCAEFANLLANCGDDVETAYAIARPGQEVEV